MKGNTYTILYSAVLALVCAGILTAANQMLASAQKANRDAKEKRAILNVLGVSLGEQPSPQQLLETYGKSVTEKKVGGLDAYVYEHPQVGTLTAFRFEGPGVWGRIRGLLAMRADLKTIHQMVIFEQAETPGLGGNIETPEFQGRFRGKAALAPGGQAGLRITLPGKAERPNEIDGISGATMTGDKLQEALNGLLGRIVPAGAAVEAPQ